MIKGTIVKIDLSGKELEDYCKEIVLAEPSFRMMYKENDNVDWKDELGSRTEGYVYDKDDDTLYAFSSYEFYDLKKKNEMEDWCDFQVGQSDYCEKIKKNKDGSISFVVSDDILNDDVNNGFLDLVRRNFAPEIILVSSNKNKIEEFKEYISNLKIQEGKDLKEVDGNMDEVIIHKAKAAGKGFVVEDTIVSVDNKEIVDIRWQKDSIEEGKEIKWIVSLGYNDGDKIHVYRAEVDGITTLKRKNEKAFGFDDIFIPYGTNKTLFELENEKGNFSARKMALSNFSNKKELFSIKIEDVLEWKGKYQNEEKLKEKQKKIKDPFNI